MCCRCNQPYGKKHFTEKPVKNVVNTSKNGPSSNLFMLKPNSKLETDYFFTD